MPYQAVYPTPFGPTPTGQYEYLEVPLAPGQVDGGIRPDQYIPLTKLNSFFIETMIGQCGAFGDRLDLVNGIRIYRVEVQYIWRFPSDKLGHFIITPQAQFRFVVDQPHTDVAVLREWAPCGL